MYRILAILSLFVASTSFGATSDLIQSAEELFEATKIVCSGVSDEISKVSNVSKVNTVVTSVGTVAAGGALAAGIMKSKEEKEIEELVDNICRAGGCDADTVRNMPLDQFYNDVVKNMARIAELQKKIDRSKKLGNWRTGLMAGTIGTNLASAIMAEVNKNQSDLIQHIETCNEMVKSVGEVSAQLQAAGVNPVEAPIVKKLNNVKTWCSQINVGDVEKIEKRMNVVMGTAIGGAVIGAVGTGTSIAANTDKVRNDNSESGKKKENTLNTVSNVAAGANVATGLVETGFNISLITLTKKLMNTAQECEDTL